MFEKFPLIQYSLTNDGKTLTDYILTDLTTRARLKASEDVQMTFKLNPGESPEDVSNLVYGTPYYHWVVMMLNNVFDVYTDWFMADEQLHDYCIAKYNITYVVQPANISVLNNTFTQAGHKFNPNDLVTLTADILPGGLFENTTYYVINTTTDTFQLTTTPPPDNDFMPNQVAIDLTSVGTAVTIYCDRASYPAYYIDEQNNIMGMAYDQFEGWSNNKADRLTAKNAMAIIMADAVGRKSYIPATNKSVVESSTDVVDIVEGVTNVLEQDVKDISIITNFDYEVMLNTRKQTIFVLKPEYIKTFIDQFNKVVQA